MKELSVEEKAKRYDEAFKEAVVAYKDEDRHLKATLERIFPELKESENERIRKAIINVFATHKHYEIFFGASVEDILAWLEKQGEQKYTAEEVLIKAGLKPYKDGDQWCILLGDNIQEGICGFGNSIEDALYAFLTDLIAIQGEQKETLCDKCRKEQPSHSCQDITELGRCAVEHEQKLADNIESKFHEGDWVVNNTTFNLCHVLKVEHGQYVCDDCSFPITKENEYHLWTIQDAKDGDVLAAQECYVIFKEIDGLNIKCYCTYHYMGFNPSFSINTLQNKTAFHPATKEQCDLLFQKMKEAGYKWNDEKKELKKIEQKFDIEIPFGSKDSELQEASYYIPEGFHAEIEGNRVVIKKGKQKPAEWSDDFEEEMNRYIEENFYGSADNGFFSNRTKRELEVEDVVRIGCHFAAWQKEQSDKELSDKSK